MLTHWRKAEPGSVLFDRTTRRLANMTKQRRTSQTVRIIGGKWKGRKLHFKEAAHLRPTPARVRETLFNWLRPWIHDTRCLDAFAGSGVLGLEALSQGAREVVMVEQHSHTVQGLRQTVAQLSAQEWVTFYKGDALRFAKQHTHPFDIIFLDPPYTRPRLLEDTLKALIANDLVADFVYAEAASIGDLSRLARNTNLLIEKQARAGDSHAVLMRTP